MIKGIKKCRDYIHGHSTRKDMSKRVCSVCGNNITVIYNGRQHWYGTENRFLCENCWKRAKYHNNPELRKITLERHKKWAKKTNYEHVRIVNLRRDAMVVIARGNKIECVNCGCCIESHLQINHINGSGYKELTSRSPRWLYQDIITGKRKIDDLNLLCRVCNIAHFVESKTGLKYSIQLNKP